MFEQMKNKLHYGCKKQLSGLLAIIMVFSTATVGMTGLSVSAEEAAANSNAAFSGLDSKDPKQQWQIKPSENDEAAYNIVNRNDGGLLTAKANVYATVTSGWSTKPTRWTLNKVTKGSKDYYRFINNTTGRALLSYEGQIAEAAADETNDAQLW